MDAIELVVQGTDYGARRRMAGTLGPGKSVAFGPEEMMRSSRVVRGRAGSVDRRLYEFNSQILTVSERKISNAFQMAVVNSRGPFYPYVCQTMQCMRTLSRTDMTDSNFLWHLMTVSWRRLRITALPRS